MESYDKRILNSNFPVACCEVLWCKHLLGLPHVIFKSLLLTVAFTAEATQRQSVMECRFLGIGRNFRGSFEFQTHRFEPIVPGSPRGERGIGDVTLDRIDLERILATPLVSCVNSVTSSAKWSWWWCQPHRVDGDEIYTCVPFLARNLLGCVFI